MKPSLTAFLLIISTAFFLSACNSSQSDASNNNASDSDSVTLSDLTAFIDEIEATGFGVWQAEQQVNLAGLSRNTEARVVPRESTNIVSYKGNIKILSENDLIEVQECSPDEQHANFDLSTDNYIRRHLAYLCPVGETKISYFKKNTPVNIRGPLLGADLHCDEVLVSTLEYFKLRDQPNFASGEVSYTSAQFDDFTTEEDVCSNINDQYFKIEASGPDEEDFVTDTWKLEWSAPYTGSDRLGASLTFTDNIGAGTYTVPAGGTSVMDGTAPANSVDVTFYSTAFGGGTTTTRLDASSGEVTIEAGTIDSVKGSFNLMLTPGGDQVTGAFWTWMGDKPEP